MSEEVKLALSSAALGFNLACLFFVLLLRYDIRRSKH